MRPKLTLRFDWSFLVGYDFFISYRRNDATPYASALAQLLERADFRCFLDDNEAVPGMPLTDRLRKALLRSKKLIVVASPGLVESPWVPQEIEIFFSTGRDIIPINIQGGLQKATQVEQKFEILKTRDALWIDETLEVGPDTEPSAHVIGKLQKNFQYQKANRLLRTIIGAVAAGLIGSGALAYWQMRVAQDRLELSRSQALAADARRQVSSELHTSLLTAIRAYDIRPSLEAQTALLESLNSARKIRRILPCDVGQKAVGVAFSGAQPQKLALACISSNQGTSRTSIRVVDLNGALLRAAPVDGDGRKLEFLDGATLSVDQADRVLLVDLANGRVRNADSSPSAALIQSSTNVATPSIPSRCEPRHPKGVRYLTSAQTTDRRFSAYTTEANEIVVEDRVASRCYEPLRAHTHNVLSIAWSEDGRYLASAGAIGDGDEVHGIILWDRDQLHPAAAIAQVSTPASGGVLAISSDGTSWLCAGCSQSVVWNGTAVPMPDGLAPTAIRLAAMREDGRQAAIGSDDGRIFLLSSLVDRIEVRSAAPSGARLRGLLYSGDFVVGVDVDGGIRVHTTGAAPPTRSQPKREIECVGNPASAGDIVVVEWNPKGQLRVALVDLKTQKQRHIEIARASCSDFAYSAQEGVAVLTSSEYEPALVIGLDGHSGARSLPNPLRAESGLPTVLRKTAISRDAKRAFALSDERDLALFDLPSQRLIGVLGAGETRALAVSKDGARAISISEGRLALWTLQPSQWRKLSGELAGVGASAGK